MKTFNRITLWIWVVSATTCLCGAAFCGAWWHLFTAGVCMIMMLLTLDECRNDKRRDGRDTL